MKNKNKSPIPPSLPLPLRKAAVVATTKPPVQKSIRMTVQQSKKRLNSTAVSRYEEDERDSEYEMDDQKVGEFDDDVVDDNDSEESEEESDHEMMDSESDSNEEEEALSGEQDDDDDGDIDEEIKLKKGRNSSESKREDQKEDDSSSGQGEKKELQSNMKHSKEKDKNAIEKSKLISEINPIMTTTHINANPAFQSDGRYRNKQRCLTICSRGITSRYRHLLEDLRTLIPHHKKDSKLDANKNNGDSTGKAVNDIAEMTGCNSVLFLECRKHQDAYLWVGLTKSPHSILSTQGPSAKFLVENFHSMDELRLTGNSMKGSRPILTFDDSFDQLDHLKILKCLFVDIFGTPRGHPKSKPFIDRVMSFYYADGKIWVRNYQILEQEASNAKEARQEKKTHGKDLNTSLVEIGPRFVLNPIRIFRGSFGGQTLYQNKDFVSPNLIRSMEMKKKGHAYEMRKDSQKKRKSHKESIVVPENPLDSVFH